MITIHPTGRNDLFTVHRSCVDSGKPGRMVGRLRRDTDGKWFLWYPDGVAVIGQDIIMAAADFIREHAEGSATLEVDSVS